MTDLGLMDTDGLRLSSKASNPSQAEMNAKSTKAKPALSLKSDRDPGRYSAQNALKAQTKLWHPRQKDTFYNRISLKARFYRSHDSENTHSPLINNDKKFINTTKKKKP